MWRTVGRALWNHVTSGQCIHHLCSTVLEAALLLTLSRVFVQGCSQHFEAELAQPPPSERLSAITDLDTS
jgi:hypothetical protein